MKLRRTATTSENGKSFTRIVFSAVIRRRASDRLARVALSVIFALVIASLGSLIAKAGGCPGANFTQAAGSPIGVGKFPLEIASADFNLDGKPDLVVTNDNSANVTILLGNGSGGFIPAPGSPVAVGLSPVGVAVGDLNLDGKPDIAVANYAADSISILLGNGSGGFSASTIGAGSSPNTIVVGDFNLDNKPDLAVVNNVSSGTVTILLGNGIGGFSPASGSPVSVGANPYSLAAGDFNLDGKPDLAVTNFGAASVTILLGNGTGGFSPASSSPISVGAVPGWVAVGDLNLDGKPDLVVANDKSGSNLNILLGDGSGGFVQAAGSPITGSGTPIFVTISDLNLDGKPDLAFTNFNKVGILFGDGTGSFAEPAGSPVTVGSSPRTVAIADFNLDGKPDFATTNGDSNDVTIELNTCTPTPGTLQLSAAISSINESAGASTISVTRTGGSNGAVSVQYATSNGSAVAGQDYTGVSGTLNWADGDSSAKTFNVPIVNDTLDEPDETINLTLSNPSGGATLGSPSTATLTIVDDDPAPSISINDVSQAEGNSGTIAFNFTVSLSAASGKTVSTNYTTVDNTALGGSDYQPANDVLTFSPGQTSKQITILVNGDTQVEPNETFLVTLYNLNNASVGKATGLGTILNDDSTTPTVQFSAASYSVQEDLTALTITVTRSGDTSGSASVNYASVDGTATQKGDFELALGTLNFAPGDTSRTFQVLINEDMYVEGNETFTLSLSNPSGASIGQQSTSTVTIVDDSLESVTNPIDDPQSFAYMQYHDFLGREPDSIGLQNWVNTLAGCPNGGYGEFDNPNCDRVHVSAGFYLSDEFQGRGYWAYRFYQTSLGRAPHYTEFIPDLLKVGGPLSPQQELINKQAFTDEWVNRPEFKAKYDALVNPMDYVNGLCNTAGVNPANHDALVTSLQNNQMTRAQVLRAIVESKEVEDKFFIQGFVSMQYFGYLRRDPDTTGYNNWVTTLTNDPGNYRHMIFGFIYSNEYRQRFGQ
jgi:hypothetical protein